MNGGEKWEKSKKDEDKVGRKKKEKGKVLYKIQRNFIWHGIKRTGKIGVNVRAKFFIFKYKRKRESFEEILIF